MLMAFHELSIYVTVHSEKKRSQNGSSEAPFLSAEQTPLWHFPLGKIHRIDVSILWILPSGFLEKNGPSLQKGAVFQNGSSESPFWLQFFLSVIPLISKELERQMEDLTRDGISVRFSQ